MKSLCAGYRGATPCWGQGATPIGGLRAASLIGSRVKRLAQGELMPCVNSYWVLPDAEIRRFGVFAAAPLRENERRLEGWKLKLTRHNGRSGKHGTYNPRHNDRNRTVEDLLKNNKTCPEESIYQIGTMEESVPAGTLALIVSEFYEEFERRFGSHIHILDWALHLDEGTPHIHERHVFDCKNRYGELCPQQEKALEELGFELPDPSKPKGKHNNRKQTFDAVCRTLLFDISRKHGVHLEQEPFYGGRAYLEKQDYILMKQKEQLAAQEQKLEELTLKIEDVETLVEEVSDIAYDKAVEVVTNTVRLETHKEDFRLVEETKNWVLSPERKAPQKEREYAAARLDGVISKIKNAMQSALSKIQKKLMQPEVKQAGKQQIQEKAKESILAFLKKAKQDSAQRESNRKKQREKQDMEL